MQSDNTGTAKDAPTCIPAVTEIGGGNWQYTAVTRPTCASGACTQTDCPAGFVFNATYPQPAQTNFPDGCVYEGVCKACNQPGHYCPAATPDQLPCPAGSYCPDYGLPIPCSEGHYCPRLSSAPIPCPWGVKCRPEKISVGFQFYIIIIGAIIVMLVGLVFIVRWRNTRKKKAGARVLSRGVAEKLLTDLRIALGGPHDAGVSLKGLVDKFQPVRITFEKLSLTLKSNDQQVLHNVSGSIAGGAMVAIMGGSGAGKTTFMNTLCGRAYYGKMSGDILLNGKKVDMNDYRTAIGFVPQDDVMFDELSVYDNLYYSARLRLPASMTNQQILDIVDDCILLFDLEEIQATVVGSPEKRGISGGQKKRVNIAMEVVAYPRLLFLDEPTSGLDASSAMQVMRCLSRLRGLGITVVSVIHQPRYSVFRTFSGVLLLGMGGKPVYFGPCGQIQSYFENLGYEVPDGENIADWFIDVVSGAIDRHDADGNVIPTSVEDLNDIWIHFCGDGAGFTSPPPTSVAVGDMPTRDNELWSPGGRASGGTLPTPSPSGPAGRVSSTTLNREELIRTMVANAATPGEENPGSRLARLTTQPFEPQQMRLSTGDVNTLDSVAEGGHDEQHEQTLPLMRDSKSIPSINDDPDEAHQILTLHESVAVVLGKDVDDVKDGNVKLGPKELRLLFTEVGLIPDNDEVANACQALGKNGYIPMGVLSGEVEVSGDGDDEGGTRKSKMKRGGSTSDYAETLPKSQGPPFWRQFKDLFAREFSLFDPVFYTVTVVGVAFASYTVGAFSSAETGDSGTFSAVFLFSIITVSLPMDLFMKHKTMWVRERLAGARPTPYWFVKMIRGLIDCVAMTCAWTIPWYYLSSPVFNLADALLTFVLIAYFSTAYGHLFSVIVPRALALLVAVMFAAMFASVFGGINPIYKNMNLFQKIAAHFGQGIYAFDMLNIQTIMRNVPENREAAKEQVQNSFGVLTELSWLGYLYDIIFLTGWGTFLRFAVLIWLIMEANDFVVLRTIGGGFMRTMKRAFRVPGYVKAKPQQKINKNLVTEGAGRTTNTVPSAAENESPRASGTSFLNPNQPTQSASVTNTPSGAPPKPPKGNLDDLGISKHPNLKMPEVSGPPATAASGRNIGKQGSLRGSSLALDGNAAVRTK